MYGNLCVRRKTGSRAGYVRIRPFILVEYEADYCKIMRENRTGWNAICADVYDFDGRLYKGADIRIGGVFYSLLGLPESRWIRMMKEICALQQSGLMEKSVSEQLCWKMFEAF